MKLNNYDKGGLIFKILLLYLSLVSGCGLTIGNKGSSTPPETGFLVVDLGFGAATNTPNQCSGEGVIRIEPLALNGTKGNDQLQQKSYSYSGLSGADSPACRASVFFENLKTGSWKVTDAFVGTTCTVNVSANGTETNLKIWNRTCS